METQSLHNSIPSATGSTEETIFTDLADTSRFEKNLKNARIWLYVIAAIQTAIGIFEYSTIDNKDLAMIAGLIDIGIAFVFFTLALWSRKQPFAAFTTALVLYVIINITLMVLNPSNISGFYIIKILVVIALVKAINSANEIRKVKESMGIS